MLIEPPACIERRQGIRRRPQVAFLHRAAMVCLKVYLPHEILVAVAYSICTSVCIERRTRPSSSHTNYQKGLAKDGVALRGLETLFNRLSQRPWEERRPISALLVSTICGF